jgi:hypothetical protein
MEITTVTLGVAGLAALAIIAAVFARSRRRAAANPFVKPSVSPARPARRGSTHWFSSDPVLFVGSTAGSANCGAGGDGGGGSCD